MVEMSRVDETCRDTSRHDYLILTGGESLNIDKTLCRDVTGLCTGHVAAEVVGTCEHIYQLAQVSLMPSSFGK